MATGLRIYGIRQTKSSGRLPKSRPKNEKSRYSFPDQWCQIARCDHLV